MKKSHYQTLYDSELNHWWYKVRRELVHLFIKKYTNSKNLSILDVGCGTGALLKELQKYGDVSGVDFSQDAIDFCVERGLKKVFKSGVEKLPYPDQTFDVVLAMDVLEHIPDDVLGISEINRVLKPGGLVIIFVPTFMFLWGITDVISQHYRRYVGGEIRNRVLKNNFDIVYYSYFNFFLFFPISIIRFIVRFFSIKIEDENGSGSGIMNYIFYKIFHLENWFIKNNIKFPFGVSFAVIGRKIK